jgi:hypothetical protein
MYKHESRSKKNEKKSPTEALCLHICNIFITFAPEIGLLHP